MKKRSEVLTYLLLVISIVVCIFLKLAPYIVYNYDFLIGFDTGKYVYDIQYKTSTSPYSLDLWVEPALSTTFASINEIARIDPIYYYQIVIPIIVSAFFILIVFLISKRLTNSALAGLFSAFYLSTSAVFLNATLDSFYRQIYSSMIFMIFLYFMERFIRTTSVGYKWLVLLSILGAGIIISHRAITLIYILTLTIVIIILFFEKKFNHIKLGILSVVGATIISSVYWIPIALVQIEILRDSVVSSVKGKTGGERIIKTLSRNDNQIVGYFKTFGTSFLPFLGLFYLLKKGRNNIVIIFTVILVLYIFFKAIFANRFLFNLELLFAVASGIYFFFLKKELKKSLFIILITCILLLSFFTSLKISLLRAPYIPYRTDSVNWIVNNIDKRNSIIFAPDSLSTILTSLGYKTAIYEFPLKTGEPDTRFTNTEQFLITGFSDPSLLQRLPSHYDNVYVAFGDWNVYNPLPRVNKLIQVSQWDDSKLFNKLYTGDKYIMRVYKMK